ncbi:uncharacterized protein LOC105858492 [Microcebus murinus]|uniref:uncharacterized protein LOC105858492 n=1 Tax=Microcebus murinus TaxID=30608 RepID=UPI003F6A66FF
MERYGARRTARMLQTCPEDCSPNPWIRDPMIRMYPKTFHYHFENRPILYGRYDTWLCFEVKRNDSPVSCGVFRNQVLLNSVCHTEECFLSWVHGILSSYEDYQITWFTSWSPCAHCADLVAEFLATHRNVSLTIFAARLYYSWDPDHRQGLRRMKKEGAQMLIMNDEEFEHCWDNFVYNGGAPWVQRWDRLDENLQILVTTLEGILRHPMDRISAETFYHQFNNTTSRRGRNSTWLCFEVETNKDSGLPVSFHRGVFRNQEPPKTPCHAEDCFLTWFHDMLSSDQDYQVTWYTSWSPCPVCADDVAGLLAGHGNVTLTICCARLYYYQDPDYQKGLRRMNRNGARLHIMSQEEFKHCWETFVDNQGEPFQPWYGLKEYHQLWNAQLEEILGGAQVQERTLPQAGRAMQQLDSLWPGQGTQPVTHQLCDLGRNPMVRIYPKTFYYHFNNRPILSGRNDTWLCFEVKTKNSPVSFYSGVFRNQGPRNARCHTELCFLAWFEHWMSPNQDYQVTWYTSWSSCANCARCVAKFLSEQPNVSLTIVTARLYYFWKPDHRQGLLRLVKEGAQVRIMCYEDFKHCWEEFVYNRGKPWVTNNNELKKNYQDLITHLEGILRHPMDRISAETFYHQFNNTTNLKDRKSTWLCFEVETNKDSGSPVSFHRGVFRNQEPPKTPCHAEDCFLTWFHDMLSSDQDYQVTWYTSWSPCPVCADDVAGLLAGHGNVTLTICCARLYYHCDPKNQKGLRRMNRNGARLHIMSQEEFKHCWETFVDNQGEPFQPWDGLKEYHQLWNAQLEEILGFREELLRP